MVTEVRGAGGNPARALDVLVVDDDADFAGYVKDVLAALDCHVRHVGTAREARESVLAAEPDLIILDLLLPDSDGLILCADIRSWTGAPILICSATVRRRDAALGLRLGADDFIAKPFDVDEFKARVESLLRRGAAMKGPSMAQPEPPAHPQNVLRVGELTVDRVANRVMLGGSQIPVSPIEIRLLAALMSRAGDVLTRQELVRMVWGNLPVASDRTIDVHIRRLREKMSYRPGAAPPIVSVRGFGYKMAVPERERSSAFAPL
jgi:DNA-binding response OmpR family regulator